MKTTRAVLLLGLLAAVVATTRGSEAEELQDFIRFLTEEVKFLKDEAAAVGGWEAKEILKEVAHLEEEIRSLKLILAGLQGSTPATAAPPTTAAPAPTAAPATTAAPTPAGSKVVFPLKKSPVSGYKYSTVFGVHMFTASNVSDAKHQHIC